MESSGSVRLGVDVGGTFTDVVLVTDDGVTTAKVSTTPDQSDGVLTGIERACEQRGIDPASVDRFRHAMTVATNAMLEGGGAKTALVTTAGFGDVLAIGRQDRPSLYDLSASRPAPLVPGVRRYEIEERATPDGTEKRVSKTALDDLLGRLDEDIESIAVCLLHAYQTPENEQMVASFLRENTDATVIASHETLPEFREYERTATTVADAYVTPVIARYLDRLVDGATERDIAPPQVMQSNGGIAPAQQVKQHGVRTVLSGPAAGVVGASLFDKRTHEGIITFDMGGTSSDVGLVRGGAIDRTTTATVGGYPVHVPMVDVETVGAGGGSIAWVDAGGALRVGPESAGAEPGPVAYGRGGEEPTVTDAAVVLGYLGDEIADGLALAADAAEQALSELATTAGLADATEAARGVYRVANATMTRTIRSVTVERGRDPRSFALVAFGGAGPMHAAALASNLGVDTVCVPRANGVLSALGLLAADEQHNTVRTLRQRLDTVTAEELSGRYETLVEDVLARTDSPDQMSIQRQADLRYVGQSHELTVDVPQEFDADTVAARFQAVHDRVRGYVVDDPVELVNIRVTGTVSGSNPDITHNGTTSDPVAHRTAFFDEEFRDVPVYDRERLPAGTRIDGPALFEGGESTVVLPTGWVSTVDGNGTLRLEVTT